MMESRAELAEKEHRYRQVLQMRESRNWQHLDALGSEALLALRVRRDENLRRQWELQDISVFNAEPLAHWRSTAHILRAEQADIEADMQSELRFVLLRLKAEVADARARSEGAQARLEAPLSAASDAE
jgi:hypothetical protein